MTLLMTYAKIQEIAAAIDGINSAPTVMPGSLTGEHLPIALCFPGPAEWKEQAVGFFRQDRTMYLRVFVRPIATGDGPDEGFQEVLPLLQVVGDTFNRNMSLDNTVDHIQAIFDGGVRGDMDFAGVAYHGFELSFQVTIKEE